jgi:hypothetical protein
LEPHSRTEDTPESRSVLEGQLRESYGRVVYSHKTQEKCANILLSRWGRIKFLQIALSALTTAGFVGAVFGAGPLGALLGLVISVLLLGLNAYTKDYDLGELAQKHRQAVISGLSVRAICHYWWISPCGRSLSRRSRRSATDLWSSFTQSTAQLQAPPRRRTEKRRRR